MIPSRLGRFWPLIKRIYNEFFEDRIPTVAGGITFFVLLALFPAISAAVSLFGIFARHADITRDLDLVSGFLPEGGVTILRAELHLLTQQEPATLNATFVISFLVAVWSASGGYKALVEGLNVAFEVADTRSFLRLTCHALIFTITAVVFAAIAFGIGLMVPRLSHAQSPIDNLFQLLAWPVILASCYLVLAIIYRYGPDRAHPRREWITWGGAVAAVLWVFGTRLFTWYVQNYGSYNRVYGDLGAAVGFLTWIWLSLMIVLLGAEINCELERTDTLPSDKSQTAQ